MTPLLMFAGVEFSYPQRKVFAGVSFSLSAGTCTALVGPNGVGKTSLLRIAAGALTPDLGLVLLEGAPIAEIPRRRRACLIALVPQQLDVPFDFTVQQIVAQGRTPHLGVLRGPARDDRLAIEKALEMTDCLRLRHRIFNELSGGERQRVKIALGLAQQPKLLLLDEPTQNLDIGRQAELIELLHSLRNQGITILASIHDLHLVEGNFSTVHLLDPSRGMISGDPRAVLTSENLSQAFHCRPGAHPLLLQRSLSEERV